MLRAGRHRALLVVVVVAASGGCPDLAVGPGAVVECAGTEDCPPETQCRAVIARCVPDDAETTPPDVSSLEVDPPAGKSGTAFVLTLVADEPLFAPPVVVVDPSRAKLPAAFVEAEGEAYVFRYTASGAESTGTADVDIALVDAVGNAVTRTASAMRLDFSPPVVERCAFTAPLGRTSVRREALALSCVAEQGVSVLAGSLVDADSGAALLAFAAEVTSFDEGGATKSRVEGSVDLAPTEIAHGTRIFAEVVLADDVGNGSAPAAARTGVLVVDLEAPSGAVVIDATVTPSLAIQVVLPAEGAPSEVCLREVASVDDTSAADCATADWVAYVPQRAFTLSAGAGEKHLAAFFRDEAGNVSDVAADSVVYVDDFSSQPEISPPEGQTAIKAGDIVEVSGSGPSGSTVASAALLDGDTVVQALALDDVAIDELGVLSGSFTYSPSDAAALDGRSVKLQVMLELAGQQSSAANSRSDPLLVDETPPAQPVAQLLELIESLPDGVPDPVDDAANTFRLTGRVGSAPDGLRYEISPALATEPSVSGDVLAGGSFATVTLPFVEEEAWYVRAIDRAGNASDETLVRTPLFADLVAGPARYVDPGGGPDGGVVFAVRFSEAMLLEELPRVALDELSYAAGALDVEIAGEVVSYFMQASPPSDREGRDCCVLRVTATAHPTVLAEGSTGTAAVRVSFDRTAPLVDAANVSVVPGAPGSDDVIRGAPGAIADAVYDAEDLIVKVWGDRRSTLLGEVTAGADGGFAAVSLGDDARDDVELQVFDPWDNYRWVAFENDRRGPALGELSLTPPAQQAGGTVVIAFTLTDASDLAALPAVTVAGTAATLELGDVDTSGGAVAFRYRAELASSLPPGEHPVEVAALDEHGNSSSYGGAVLVDATQPASELLVPDGSGAWGGRPMVRGNASDDGAVDFVEVALLDLAGDRYFDGTAFSSPAPVWLLAQGTESWGLSTDAVPFGAGDYRIFHRAHDVAGLVEAEQSADVTIAPTARTAPQAVSAHPVADGRIRVAWSGGGGPYRVYFGPADVGLPLPVVESDQGAAPVTVTGQSSVDLTGLPPAAYVVAVTEGDDSDESALSSLAEAPSRWWRPVEPPLGVDAFAFVAAAPASGRFYAVADRRVHVSDDGGDSFREVAVADSAITALHVDDDLVVAGGTVPGTLLVSADGGTTFYRTALPPIADAGSTSPDLGVVDIDRQGDDVVVTTVARVLAGPPGEGQWSATERYAGIESLARSVVFGDDVVTFKSNGEYLFIDENGAVTVGFLGGGAVDAAVVSFAGTPTIVALAPDGIFESVDGSSWQRHDEVYEATQLVSCDGVALALGREGAMRAGAGPWAALIPVSEDPYEPAPFVESTAGGCDGARFVIGGGGGIHASDDAGAGWRVAGMPPNVYLDRPVVAVAGPRVVVGGSRGLLLSSANGGRSFDVVNGRSAHLAVDGLVDLSGRIIASRVPSVLTDDGWSVLPLPPDARRSWAIAPGLVVAHGEYTSVRSLDDGVTFESPRATPLLSPYATWTNGVDVVVIGELSGSEGEPPSQAFAWSGDGGLSYAVVHENPGDDGISLFAGTLVGDGARVVWLQPSYSLGGVQILTSGDGGQTWSDGAVLDAWDLLASAVRGDALAVSTWAGADPALYFSSNGGFDLAPVVDPAPEPSYYKALAFDDDGALYAAHGTAVLIREAGGAVRVASLGLTQAFSPTAVAVDGDDVLVVGNKNVDSGVITMSADGGQTFFGATHFLSSSPPPLSSALLRPGDTALVGGQHGALYELTPY